MKSIIIFSEFRSNLIRVIRIHMNTIHIFYSYRLAVTQLRLSKSACLPVRVPLVPTERTVAHIQILRYSDVGPSSLQCHYTTLRVAWIFGFPQDLGSSEFGAPHRVQSPGCLPSSKSMYFSCIPLHFRCQCNSMVLIMHIGSDKLD